jgi:hypothetical protein
MRLDAKDRRLQEDGGICRKDTDPTHLSSALGTEACCVLPARL